MVKICHSNTIKPKQSRDCGLYSKVQKGMDTSLSFLNNNHSFPFLETLSKYFFAVSL